jgi:hypothetical protein
MRLTEQEQKFYKLIMEDFKNFPTTFSILTPEIISSILALQLTSLTNAIGAEVDATNMIINKLEARIKELEELVKK